MLDKKNTVPHTRRGLAVGTKQQDIKITNINNFGSIGRLFIQSIHLSSRKFLVLVVFVLYPSIRRVVIIYLA